MQVFKNAQSLKIVSQHSKHSRIAQNFRIRRHCNFSRN